MSGTVNIVQMPLQTLRTDILTVEGVCVAVQQIHKKWLDYSGDRRR